MPLLSAQNLSLAFGWRPLLDDVSFSVDKGDKIALLGRNGEGKSTLLNVLRGKQAPDDGELQLEAGVRIAYLPQDPPAGDEHSVLELIKEGFSDVYQAIADYERIASHPENMDEKALAKAESIINANDGWMLEQKIANTLAQFELNPETKMSALSGGWRRRAWLARAVVKNPQILLLDEPTNHLDIAAIDWLEKFIEKFAGAVIFVTHDREFMQHVANRIWQLDRGQITDVAGSYQRFLQTREEILHAEAEAQVKFDKKLAQEEVWIRKGIQARRTRNEGRVRALKAMREERSKRISQQKNVNLTLDSGNKSGKQVIVAEHVSFAYDDKISLIHDFSYIIERGEKIGIIGANGMGKTTLINLLLGKLKPTAGKITLGTNLQVAYFDQLRSQIDREETLREALGQGKDYVEINGERKHLASYLQDFLFPPERWNTPVSALSGGERARLLLAKLFAQPANFLVFDEPTNDLDVETLELLEEVLASYTGTALIVSHDRAFLDNVVTRSWVFNAAKNTIQHVPGGFSDWLQQGGAIEQLQQIKTEPSKAKTAVNEKLNTSVKNISDKKNTKLSYKLQRELEQLPTQIDALEKEIDEFSATLQTPEFQQKPLAEQEKNYHVLTQKQQQLDKLMERWMELDA